MRKQDFIEMLKAALNGRIPSSLVMENMKFYEDYISTEVQKGREEEEVLASLGDPRLIARTIIDTNKSGGAEEGFYRNVSKEQENIRPQRSFTFGGLPGWFVLLIVVLVIIVVGRVAFSMLSALLPILLPVAIIFLIIKVFRDWLK